MKYIKPNWNAPLNVKAYTTLRTGWGNQAHHLNQAPRSPAVQAEIVKLIELLSLPSEPIWIKQIHGAKAIEATLDHRGHEADASFTAKAKRICMILSADCLPILLCNRLGTEVAAIHAGWRGLLNGVIPSTIQSLKSPPNDLIAWLGPAIGPAHFEVGADVYELFNTAFPTSSHAFKSIGPHKWLADLYALANMQLKTLGVPQVYGGDFCTFTESDQFFSFRRDQGQTGRMATLIWLNQ